MSQLSDNILPTSELTFSKRTPSLGQPNESLLNETKSMRLSVVVYKFDIEIKTKYLGFYAYILKILAKTSTA